MTLEEIGRAGVHAERVRHIKEKALSRCVTCRARALESFLADVVVGRSGKRPAERSQVIPHHSPLWDGWDQASVIPS
jgi:hypothetical protein